MNRCASVRRRGSAEQCPCRPMRGHTFCGRHARMRVSVLWIDANVCRGPPIVRIQACVRGWLIRRRLSYAGRGALSRTGLTNDEDIITYADKDRVYPMDFFSFEENGKTWWFEFSSLWTWCMRNEEPVNPYTKVPLSSDTRKRLRTLWGYKRRHREELPAESQVYGERLRYRLHILCQHFADYGYVGIHADFFMRFSKTDYVTLFVLLQRDIETVIPATYPFRVRLTHLFSNRIHAATIAQNANYILQSVTLLLHIVTLYRDPYAVTFSILSAAYRC